MPNRESRTGSELFIVDNSDNEWKVRKYLHDWCQLSRQIDIATGYFEIGSLLSLDGEWQKMDKIRILMGDEVSMRTRKAFEAGLADVVSRLDASIEGEKETNDFLAGVPAIVDAVRSGRIECRVYRKDKFHAKAYITHARMEVVGSSALVGSSNFTFPGLTENIELNVQVTGGPVRVLQEWYDGHWDAAEDVAPVNNDLTDFQHMVELFSRRETGYFKDNPGLEERLGAFPNRVFSGKAAIKPEAKGVFFCYARPGRDVGTGEWSEEAGDVKWYLYLLKGGEILEDADAMFKAIQCAPETPRACKQEQELLVDIRMTLDKHLNKTYLRKVQAPVGVKPILRAWMELD